jgi:hypothetical protein
MQRHVIWKVSVTTTEELPSLVFIARRVERREVFLKTLEE